VTVETYCYAVDVRILPWSVDIRRVARKKGATNMMCGLLLAGSQL
jgi:hypothetical protein